MELSKWVWSLFFSWEAEAIIYMLVYEQMRAEKSLTVISSSTQKGYLLPDFHSKDQFAM